MKARIAAAMTVGVILIGVLGWPAANQSAPLDAVRAGNVTLLGALSLVILAFVTGSIGYFVAWPHGREIGILAVPTGLAVWAIRSGTVSNSVQLNPSLAQRQSLFSAMRWEGGFWILIVAAGFAGVLFAQRMRNSTIPSSEKTKINLNAVLSAAVAIIGTIFIAHFFIGRFAQDVKAYDPSLTFVMSQPPVAQIAFGVIAAFSIAGFAVKAFLDMTYIWPAVAAALVSAFAVAVGLKEPVLGHIAEAWPAVFFPHSSLSVLPLQMVAFGTLGSIAGYWLAIRYGYWRKHEMN